MFQMFVGEIGINWHDYLYRLTYCQILLISRGYHNRHHAGWEQARLVAYNARFCMGSKDPIPLLTEWIKFPGEQTPTTPISQEDIDELQAEMDAINAGTAEQVNP